MSKDVTGTTQLNGSIGASIARFLIPERTGMKLAVSYMLAIVGAEIVTDLHNALMGAICHAVILTALLVHSTVVPRSPTRNLLLAVSLAPLTRILSLAMPLTRFDAVYWYVIIYPALFLATVVAARRMGYTRREMGVSTGVLRWQLPVALTGLFFGVAEYYILRPEPLAPEFTFTQVLFPALVLLLGPGLVEEFMFRGVIQRASKNILGKWWLVYVALLFASLHMIHYSNNPLDIPFVFAVAVFYGWAVNKTGSLLGVTLSHGITNITLYLVVPFLLA